MEALLKRFSDIKPFKKSFETLLRSVAVRTLVEKDQIILKNGEINNKVYFIEKGLVCAYEYKDRNIYSNWIRKEGDFFGGIILFLRQSPSRDTFIALEPCELWSITYGQLNILRDESPRLAFYERELAKEYLIRLEKERRIYRYKTIKKRLDFLANTNPDFLQRAPIRYLASYLDIDAKILSNLRLQKKRDNKDLPNIRKSYL
jgi:CRP/FNR family transcriptional regulator, anaerobic regulatory protein